MAQSVNSSRVALSGSLESGIAPASEPSGVTKILSLPVGEQPVVKLSDVHQTIDVGASSGGRMNSKMSIPRSVPFTIEDYLARPRYFGGGTWTVGSTIGFASLDIYQLFLSDVEVSTRLLGYNFVRGDMEIIFSISGSQYYYGMFELGYAPGILPDNIQLINTADSFSRSAWISSLDHKAYLSPSSANSVTLFCPYSYYRPMINRMRGPTNYDDGTTMAGAVFYQSSTLLYNCSGSSSYSDLRYNFYMRMVNVELSGLVSSSFHDFEVQGIVDDLQESKVISKTADTVSQVAGALESVPILAPIAGAVKFGADVFGSIASFFGFSKPSMTPSDKMCQIVSINPLGQMSTYVGMDTTYKLTLDPRNEIQVATENIDGVPHDQLALKTLFSREVLIDSFLMNNAATDPVNTEIFRIAVTPEIYHVGIYTNSGSGTSMLATPSGPAVAAFPFKNWRGTMCYRIRAVCSVFHKAKLLLVYTPNAGGIPMPSNIDTATRYFRTTSVDISPEMDVIVKIHFCADVSWKLLSTGYDTTDVFYAPQPFNTVTSVPRGTALHFSNGFIDDFAMGALNLLVYNTLTAPSNDANSNVILLVSCWGEDMVFANPIAGLPINFPVGSSFHDFECQSLIYGDAPTAADNQSAVKDYMGEHISSARQLMKQPWTYFNSMGRSGILTSIFTANEAYNSSFIYYLSYPLAPFVLRNGPPYALNHMAAAGNFMDAGVIAGGGTNIVQLNRVVLFNYLRRCFSGMRGSFKYYVSVPGCVAGSSGAFRVPQGIATVARLDINESNQPVATVTCGFQNNVPSQAVTSLYPLVRTGVVSSSVSIATDPGFLTGNGVQRFYINTMTQAFAFEIPGFCTDNVMYAPTNPYMSGIYLSLDHAGNYPYVALKLEMDSVTSFVSGADTILYNPVKFDVAIGEDFNFVWWQGHASFGIT